MECLKLKGSLKSKVFHLYFYGRMIYQSENIIAGFLVIFVGLAVDI